MDKIQSWEEKITIKSEIASKYKGCNYVTPNASLTWLEVFVGVATIIKSEQSIEKARRQYSHMLFGYTEAFIFPEAIFNELISILIESEMIERIDSHNVRLSYYGIVFLMHNWLIDRSVYSSTRLQSDVLAKVIKNEQGGMV